MATKTERPVDAELIRRAEELIARLEGMLPQVSAEADRLEKAVKGAKAKGAKS